MSDFDRAIVSLGTVVVALAFILITSLIAEGYYNTCIEKYEEGYWVPLCRLIITKVEQ